MGRYGAVFIAAHGAWSTVAAARAWCAIASQEFESRRTTQCRSHQFPPKAVVPTGRKPTCRRRPTLEMGVACRRERNIWLDGRLCRCPLRRATAAATGSSAPGTGNGGFMRENAPALGGCAGARKSARMSRRTARPIPARPIGGATPTRAPRLATPRRRSMESPAGVDGCAPCRRAVAGEHPDGVGEAPTGPGTPGATCPTPQPRLIGALTIIA